MNRTTPPQGLPALSGIRVLDLTQFEAGTSCTQMLAWLGAEVIKVEPPGKGEQGRRISSDDPAIDSPYFLLMNANKRSVTCNFKLPDGKKIIQDLIPKVDIFIENFAPGVIERLGFGYDDVKGMNEKLIYAQIKGFPQDGPFANLLAFDPVAQAAGGGVSITGEKDQRPVKPGMNVGDTGAGLHCLIGILAALYQREQTGKGQKIDVSMQESIINFGRIAWAAQALLGKAAPRTGNQSILGSTSPSEVYPCLGGGPNDYIYIYITRAASHQWHALLKVIKREELLDDPRFVTPTDRAKNYAAVDEVVGTWTKNYNKHEAMRILGDAGVPASAVFDTLELTNDPHLRKRGMFATVDHPTRGEFVMPGFPIKMSESFVPVLAAPLLGADNQAVYQDLLGYDDEKLKQLLTNQAI